MSVFRVICLIFLFNPYLGLPFLVPSDIQPFCLLTLVIYIWNSKSIKLNPLAKLIFQILLLFACLSFVLQISSAFNTFDFSLIDQIRSLYPLAAPPVYFLGFYSVFCSLKKLELLRSVHIYFFIYFFGVVLNILGLSKFTNLFVNRSIFLEFGARGFPSFYPEPSRVSEQALIVLCLLLLSGLFNIRLLTLLFLNSILAGSGQTIITFIQVFIASILAYSGVFLGKLKHFISSLKIPPIWLRISICTLPLFLFFVITNSNTRGMRVIALILQNGLKVIAADEGVQVKLTGFVSFLASLVVLSPVFHFPDIGFLSRPHFLDAYYSIYLHWFGVSSPVLLSDLYCSLCQYSVYFGMLGIISTLIISILLFKALFSRLKDPSSTANSSIVFCFSIIFLTGFLKVPAANPGIWALLSLITIPLAYVQGTIFSFTSNDP